MSIITVTDRAWDKVHENLQKTDKTTVRIGINKMGCNGHSYTFDLLDEASANPQAIEQSGHYIEIDFAAEMFLIGTELDFTGDDLFNRHFVFNNPNVESSCGCGESVNFRQP
jgi:iron-sulfur cluster assembly protein